MRKKIDKLADLTIDQLKALVREAVEEVLLDTSDPDAGLELKPEFRERLRRSVAAESDGDVAPLEDVERGIR